jgi:hypothetical protein
MMFLESFPHRKEFSMRRTLCLLLSMALMCILGTSSVRADLIAGWTFNNVVKNADNSGLFPMAADIGTGTVSLVGWTVVNGDEGTELNSPNPPGNAGNALELNGGNNSNGAMMILAVNLSMTIDPILTLADFRNGGGYDSVQVSWSTDGMNFTNFGGPYDPGTGQFTVKTFDFSAVNALDGAATAFFKFTYTGAGPGQAGHVRIDNVLINATAIPEPSSLAICGIFAAAFGAAGLRRGRKLSCLA